MGSSRVVGFIRVRTAGRWVHPGSLGVVGCLWFALVIVGFILGVVEFIRVLRVHSHSLRGLLSSSAFVGFTRVRPGGRWVRSWGRWVHLGSPWGSLVSLGFALGVVVFIKIHSSSRWES